MKVIKNQKFLKKLLKIVIVIFWFILFIIIFTKLEIFSYRHIDVTAIKLISFKLRELQEPAYKKDFSNIIRESDNPNLSVELIPNSDSFFDGYDVRLNRITMIKINSQGLRDYEYHQRKQRGIFRIAVLGDSFTFGMGVELNETYPKILENMLNQKDKKYEVLNFGVPGYSLSDECEQLKTKVMNFSPDLVIIGVTLANDFKIVYSASTLIDCTNNQNLCIERIESPLKEFNEISITENIPILMVTLTPEMVELQKKLYSKYNFYHLNLDVLYSHERFDLSKLQLYYPLDGHFNAYGHKIVAGTIYGYLSAQHLI